MPSVKEVKSMETKKATIERGASHTYLVLETATPSKIILTEDNPNNIKATFNTLLKELKGGLFQFKLEDEATDLFHNICVEYVTQLNVELKSVFAELKTIGMLEVSSAGVKE